MSTATITAPIGKTGADEGRIGLRGNLRHIGALVRRNLVQIKNDPETLFDVLLMPIIFILLFVYVFGGAIAGKGNQQEYVQYLVPGMMAMMGMNVAMAVGTGVNEDFRKGVMDRFRTMPIARSSVLIAKIVVEILRMLLATAILLAMGLLLGLEIRGSLLEFAGSVLLSTVFGAALMWIFILLGLSVKTPQAVQGMAMLVLMPLQFGSSIFAPTTSMPGWLEGFTKVNPLSNLADAARALINGQGALAHPALITLGWTVVITAVTMPLAVRKFRSKT
ncbi:MULTISPECIES: ABC transporter permease [Streptomyces]|uniref:ABC transporter permease n=1 Tax=Streptomyces TaxID=1883 RepID=UPI001962FC6B|nr:MULTISPECIES: ABC transporter permease [Streptomyces]QRX91927.1 ABC transporter permease [Streptomyces noursei]UJB41700.1 ABC transporter permease [Streptomyces sp. A1-5]